MEHTSTPSTLLDETPPTVVADIIDMNSDVYKDINNRLRQLLDNQRIDGHGNIPSISLEIYGSDIESHHPHDFIIATHALSNSFSEHISNESLSHLCDAISAIERSTSQKSYRVVDGAWKKYT